MRRLTHQARRRRPSHRRRPHPRLRHPATTLTHQISPTASPSDCADLGHGPASLLVALPDAHYFGLSPFLSEATLEGLAAASGNHRSSPQPRRRHRDDDRSHPEQTVFHAARAMLWAMGFCVFLIAVLNTLGYP